MLKIVGLKTTEFTIKESGNKIKGVTIYTTEPIPSDKGMGVETDHFFLSDAKVGALDFELKIGSLVQRLFNRWGKTETLRLCGFEDDFDELIE